MNKSRQQFLLRWLKQQRHYGGRWLRLSVISGVFSAVLIIVQAGLLALLLENFILKQQIPVNTLPLLLVLAGCFVLRALLHYFRELFGFRAGMAIRQAIRQQIIDRLESCGPVWVKTRPTGSWTTLLQEQIENMQDYYARYLPQMSLAALIPLMILIVLAPVNWAAALILFCTAPLIPLFMAMVGMGAAEANRRNFHALARLSGDFLDRLRGLDTLRLFHRGRQNNKPSPTALSNSASGRWKSCGWHFYLLLYWNFSQPFLSRWWRFISGFPILVCCISAIIIAVSPCLPDSWY